MLRRKSKTKVKEFRMYCGGFPETREERDKFYWLDGEDRDFQADF